MSAKKIKILMDDCMYFIHMADDAEIKEQNATNEILREKYECQKEDYSLKVREIAKDIKALKPSKYMLDKYDELNDVLEYSD